ncbi:glycosyltransferase family 4 protein [Steroidobacter cummioxidans]|uniref:glycosyltransferase family 4 protein n=1 Tax=Steroidobacter cummioxidans TaxID=1803913 RepID=UPI000E31C5FD|nr:glycosyltransferase family 4 protein [Steroidobacter cummioxidans]
MHVAQISFFADPAQRAPEELLKAWPSLVDIAECAASSGVRVSVIQASTHTQTFHRNGVSYRFLPMGRAASPTAPLGTLPGVLRDLAPDLFHVHGLGFGQDVFQLSQIAPDAPILLQDHADAPPRFWRRTAWRRNAAVISGVAFCARQQSQRFADAGLLQRRVPIYEIPESSSRFTPGNQEEARRALGVAAAAPLILWVGHLNDNKDPLTVLKGLSLAARNLPDAQLWCCFGTAPLLTAVRKRIDGDPVLRDRVRLLGCASHAEIETLMRAADLFVLGSHREGSGYSLIEALACGLPPVVTDIPSFRALTGQGAVGMLWPPDNSHALCEALLAMTDHIGSPVRAAVRAHFDAELSFESVGRKLAAAYHDLLMRKRGSTWSRRGVSL